MLVLLAAPHFRYGTVSLRYRIVLQRGPAGRPIDPAASRPAVAGRAGIETMISVNSEGPYFAVAAQDGRGRQLSRSATVMRVGATA
jgi:hypothetical protein